MPTVRTSLRLVATAAAAAAGLLLVLPVSSRGADAPLGALASSPVLPPAPADGDSLAVQVVLANLFAPSRTPPRQRYAPEDTATAVEGPSTGDSLSAASDGGPVLYGTVVADRGMVLALVQLEAAAGPRLYGVGARAGGYRVLSIAPRVVTLHGPTGRLTLRLPTQNEERP